MPTQVCNRQVTCACGRICKGLRGLKAHHRSCRTIESINHAPSDALIGNTEAANFESTDEDINDLLLENAPTLKQGVKLPRNDADWDTANSYFHATLPIHEINKDNLDKIVLKLHNQIYDYFASRFGTIESHSKEALAKYSKFTKTNLKKELRNLKDQKADPKSIKVVSKLLRKKISKDTAMQDICSTDHDMEIKKNFWSYCKKFIEPKIRVFPTFAKELCEAFFIKAFKRKGKLIFSIPDWIPQLRHLLFNAI